MQMIPVFGAWVGVAKLESLNINETLEYVKSLDEQHAYGGDNGTVTVNQRLLDDSIFENVKTEIEKLTKEYIDIQGHVVEEVKVASSWGNTLRKDEPIHVHCHPNSYVSGVFYLTEGSPLHFHNPVVIEDLFTFSPLQKWDPNNQHTWQTIYLEPKPGWIFLFPSKLKHHVEFNENDYRYSIAFNTLPIGTIGDSTKEMNIKEIR